MCLCWGGGFRAEAVPYIDENGKTQDTDTLDGVTVNNITASNIKFQEGWNYVTGNVNQDTFSLPNGDVKIILGDGCTLSGKVIQDASSLTIYAQSSGNNAGKINLSNSGQPSLIRSNGDLTINGGNINVSSPSTINANIQSQSGNVTINGGQVTITGPNDFQSGILIGSGKSITLGYMNTTDFIKAPVYGSFNFGNYNDVAPKIADGKIFVKDGDTSTKYSGTLTANAINNVKLIPLSFTVKFESNSGSGTMPPQTLASGVEQALTTNTLTRTGYTFKEWNTQQDGSGTSYADGAQVTLTENLTLYAQWTPVSYNITYELNGGTNDSANPASYTLEDAITLKAPTKNGYDFAGWTLDGSTITEIAKGSKGDITLIATWTPITYSITYNLDGGSATNPTSYTIETESFTLTNPTKDGCTFNGWTGTDLTAATQTVEIKKGSTGNREYTANYTQNQQEQQGQEPQEQEQEQGSKEYEEQVTTTSDNLAGMGTEEKAAVKYLELTDSTGTKITDLSQIDFTDFTNLNTLNLSGLKNLEQADLSQLPANVKEVSLQKTNVTSLTLKGSKVERVNAKGCTNLTNIDAEDNTSLTDLDVSDTSITSLSVKNCARLQSLNCSSCDLEAGYLNLEGCINLVSLDISKNHFGWFDYSESDLDSFECYSQDIQGWESKTTFNFTKFFNSGDVTAAGVHIIASAYTANVVGITGCNESGDKILTEYDSETGIAAFESAPAVIKYFYNTGFKNSSMDVTIHSSGYQDEEADYYLGDSGGCSVGLSFSSLILAVFAFMFNKRR